MVMDVILGFDAQTQAKRQIGAGPPLVFAKKSQVEQIQLRDRVPGRNRKLARTAHGARAPPRRIALLEGLLSRQVGIDRRKRKRAVVAPGSIVHLVNVPQAPAQGQRVLADAYRG